MALLDDRDSRNDSASAPVFALANVCYAYGPGVVALREVSLVISPGEKVAILGANGSGKSTLLKMLGGLLSPQSGQIDAFGEPLTEGALRDEAKAHRFRRRVGYLFQNSDAQLFCATVREDIAFGPLQMGLAQAEIAQRLNDLVALLGIGALLDRPPFQLSGGEKRKVALAGMLILNPDVLLLDEPTNGLDPRSQVELVELLVALHAAGKTLVTATHDLDIVPFLSDRALVFGEDHTLTAEGTTPNILRDLELLHRVNLIHPHTHRHGSILHSHPHPQDSQHLHTHEDL